MSKIGSEILVNTQTLYDQTLAQSAKLNGGGFVTVWVDWASSVDTTVADGSWSAIKAQVYSAVGAKVGSEILVNTATLNWQQDPRVAVLRDGNFVVTWTDGWDYFSWADHPGSQGVGGATSDNYGKAVKLQVFSANGTPVGPEVVAATEIRTDQTAQKITALDNGNFVITWEDWSLSCVWAADGSLYSAGGGPGLKAQVFDSVGAKVGVEVGVTGSYNYVPQITNLVDGGFVMTWHDGHYSVDDVNAQVFSNSGVRVGNEILVNTAGTGATFSTQSEERIVALSNGGFVVAWTDNNGDDSYRAVKAQVFSSTGDQVGTEIIVNTTTLSDQWHPQLAALKNGGFVVAWDNWSGTYPENSGIDVNVQIFDNSGARVGSEILANTTTAGLQGNCQIAALDDGGFAVSWFDSYGAWSGYAGVPKFQVFDALGNKVGAERTANTTPAGGGSSPITALDNGTYVIAWNAGDDSGSAVRAQVFSIALMNNAPAGSVTIAGSATQGQSLVATDNLSDIDGMGTVAYQWKADGLDIAGATTSSLVLTESHVGKVISVAASYTDGYGTSELIESNVTLAVVNVNDEAKGDVTISGTAAQGQVLTASNTLADMDGLGVISYQWNAANVAISGATGSTLTLGTAQIGKVISVAASFIDGHGTLESVASSPTTKVTSLPAQIINGSNASDVLTVGVTDNHALNGLGGIDTAVYSNNMAAYDVAVNSNGYSLSSTEWIDTLTSIERLQFMDANLAFDLDGSAGQVFRLYKAAFARAPDLAGLGNWINVMDNGAPLEQCALAFTTSSEFQSLYGANTSNEQFVTLLYLNALGRAPEAGGVTGWASQIASGAVTRAELLTQFSESVENKAAVQSSISNGIRFATAEQAAGLAQGKSFAGTTGSDTFVGTVGNDTFNGGLGDDGIDGGAGLDVAHYSGDRAGYSITVGNSLSVSGGAAGTDTLSNVERMQFADVALAFDTSGNAGQTYRLYQAAFDRTPDLSGLSDWIRGMDSGMTLRQVASGFIASPEFQGLYGVNPSDEAFVMLLYQNVLNRAPDEGGKAYWLDELGRGLTREMVLIGFSESPENQAALIGVIQGGIEYLAG